VRGFGRPGPLGPKSHFPLIWRVLQHATHPVTGFPGRTLSKLVPHPQTVREDGTLQANTIFPFTSTIPVQRTLLCNSRHVVNILYCQ